MQQKMKFLIFIVIGFILSSVAAVTIVYVQFSPVDAQDQSIEKFIVKKGQGASQIGSDLAEAGFIRSPLVFRLVVKAKGLEQQLQAGTFELSKSMNVATIAVKLTTGTEDIWVTIQEGWRKEEIAESIVLQGLSEFDSDEFLDLVSQSEGLLFPDTYLVPREMTASGFYELLLSTFDRKILLELEEEFTDSPHSQEDIVVMASLIEREAQGYQDMRQVSGVLWNRIEIGMPLQVDATLQYAKGYSSVEQTWWQTPLAKDKELESVYNTYANPGLPPHPIANPGLNAVKAALDPAQSDNLFYIHDPQGNMHLAKTLEQHNANVNKYLR